MRDTPETESFTAMNTSSLFAPPEHFADHRAERPQPLSGNQMPRCGGITTMMRLPHVPSADGRALRAAPGA
jgi:guanidinobutyrase